MIDRDRQFNLVNPDGVVIDVIDPVESYEEPDEKWIIGNGFNTYVIYKDEFPECRARFKILEYVWEDEND